MDFLAMGLLLEEILIYASVGVFCLVIIYIYLRKQKVASEIVEALIRGTGYLREVHSQPQSSQS